MKVKNEIGAVRGQERLGEMSAGVVAQIVNLPYRRLPIGMAVAGLKGWTAGRLPIGDTADCQSALQLGGLEK